MRCLTYAGETVVTTDQVASSLVELTAALARRGLAEAVSIPVFDADTHVQGDAELVVGVGNDVLSVGTTWPGADPDAVEATAELRRRLERLTDSESPSPTRAPTRATHYDRVLDDPEFGDGDDPDDPDGAPADRGEGARAPIPLRRRRSH